VEDKSRVENYFAHDEIDHFEKSSGDKVLLNQELIIVQGAVYGHFEIFI
jgi:hypothetical protein